LFQKHHLYYNRLEKVILSKWIVALSYHHVPKMHPDFPGNNLRSWGDFCSKWRTCGKMLELCVHDEEKKQLIVKYAD
jgi:hypothetical protein